MWVSEIPTPALIVEAKTFQSNLKKMGSKWPGRTLRTHVKAYKSTAMAKEIASLGHDTFCAATSKEIIGLSNAGLGEDLLLANVILDPIRMSALARCNARVTVAVDSKETIEVAAKAGIKEVVIDIDVGCYRTGCSPSYGPYLTDFARSKGLIVRGVMGYEGHLMTEPEESKAEKVRAAMELLLAAHGEIGGEIISGGGSGTWDTNTFVNELQAGSFALMDKSYKESGLPFEQALFLLVDIISQSSSGWCVANGGLKALGMDHGNPELVGSGLLFYCSDEHTTILPDENGKLPKIGERVRLIPGHVDPTVAYHEQLYLIEGDEVLDIWPIDLRNW